MLFLPDNLKRHRLQKDTKIAEILEIEIKEQAVEDIIHDIYKSGAS